MKITGERWLEALIVLAVGIAAGIGFTTLRQSSTPEPIEIVPPPAATATVAPQPTASAAPLRVYVSGEVVAPAVYTLPPGSIVDDAVRAAGGFTAAADPIAINLAQPLGDGMQITVPAKAAALPTPPPISAPPAFRSGGVEVDLGGLVNINTATQAELEALPGIGPSTAAQIIAYREANGPFTAIERIMDVPGIGEGKFGAMKALITVGP